MGFNTLSHLNHSELGHIGRCRASSGLPPKTPDFRHHRLHSAVSRIDHHLCVQLTRRTGKICRRSPLDEEMSTPLKPSVPPRPFDTQAFLSKSGNGRTLSSYKKNAKVFAQGDAADAIFYIRSGEVKLAVVSEQGREAVIAILVKGHFFGEGCLAGQVKRIATATSLGDSEVLKLSRAVVVRTLKDEPAFSKLFLAHMLNRTARVEADLVDQLFNSSEKRLARTLLLLANFGKEGRPEPIIAKITQDTLAEIIGTTRSRVSFFMNKFRRLGFVSYNGRIEVHSSLLSVVLADQPPVHKAKPKRNK
jgi:CRP/FNR family cyclic AMP-dependent transcriptional regulator